MKLELLRAYRYMLSRYGPGRAARLMRMTYSEEQEALRILATGENGLMGRGSSGPLDGATGAGERT